MKRKKLEVIIPIIILVVLVIKSTIELYGIESIFGSVKQSITTKTQIKINDDKLSIIDKNKETYQDVLNKEPYTFKLKNKKNYSVRYNIYLKKYDELIFLDGCKDNLIDIKEISYMINEKRGTLTPKNNYIIYTGILNPKEEKKFDLRIWVDKESKYDINKKHMHLKVINDMVKINTNLKEYLINKSTNNNTYYVDTDESKEMYKNKNEYLYIGTNPNNYIYFNCKNNNLNSCELFRILGIKKVMLEDLKEHYKIEIIKDNLSEEKVKYEDINYNTENNYIEKIVVKENDKYIEKKYSILSEEDYKKSFYNGYSKPCTKDITKCEKNSYLTKGDNEWIVMKNNNYRYISDGKMIVTNNDTYNYYRPVLYLKDNIIIKGGDGSKLMPYFIEYKVD